MNRREFFKVVSAAGVIAALPTQLFASQPTRIAPLCHAVRWFEANFKCSMGAPWAFVEPRPAVYEDHPEDSTWWVEDEMRDYKGLTPYNTYSIEAPNERIAVAELLSLFGAAIERHPSIKRSALYWRLEDKIKVRPHSRRVGGELVATEEQYEDGSMALILARRGLKEHEVEHDYSDGVFYINRHDESYVVLRTRIAVPEMQRLGEQDKQMHAGWDIATKRTEDM